MAHFNRANYLSYSAFLYVDGFTLALESSRDAKINASLVMEQFAKSGMEIHTGSKTSALKAKCVFFLPPGNFQLHPLPLPLPPTNSSLPITITLVKES